MIPNSLLLKKDIEARRRGIRRMYKRLVCFLRFGAPRRKALKVVNVFLKSGIECVCFTFG